MSLAQHRLAATGNTTRDGQHLYVHQNRETRKGGGMSTVRSGINAPKMEHATPASQGATTGTQGATKTTLASQGVVVGVKPPHVKKPAAELLGPAPQKVAGAIVMDTNTGGVRKKRSTKKQQRRDGEDQKRNTAMQSSSPSSSSSAVVAAAGVVPTFQPFPTNQYHHPMPETKEEFVPQTNGLQTHSPTYHADSKVGQTHDFAVPEGVSQEVPQGVHRAVVPQGVPQGAMWGVPRCEDEEIALSAAEGARTLIRDISFSGGSLFFYWQLGVAVALLDAGYRPLRVSGTSAGAIVALYVLLDARRLLPPQAALQVLPQRAPHPKKQLGTHPSAAFFRWMTGGGWVAGNAMAQTRSAMLVSLRALLDACPDAYKIVSGKLHVTLARWHTRRSWLPFELHVENAWLSNQQLLECFEAATAIPGVTCDGPVFYAGDWYVDGGFVENHPIPHPRTLLVSQSLLNQPWSRAWKWRPTARPDIYPSRPAPDFVGHTVLPRGFYAHVFEEGRGDGTSFLLQHAARVAASQRRRHQRLADEQRRTQARAVAAILSHGGSAHPIYTHPEAALFRSTPVISNGVVLSPSWSEQQQQQHQRLLPQTQDAFGQSQIHSPTMPASHARHSSFVVRNAPHIMEMYDPQLPTHSAQYNVHERRPMTDRVGTSSRRSASVPPSRMNRQSAPNSSSSSSLFY